MKTKIELHHKDGLCTVKAEWDATVSDPMVSIDYFPATDTERKKPTRVAIPRSVLVKLAQVVR